MDYRIRKITFNQWCIEMFRGICLLAVLAVIFSLAFLIPIEKDDIQLRYFYIMFVFMPCCGYSLFKLEGWVEQGKL